MCERVRCVVFHRGGSGGCELHCVTQRVCESQEGEEAVKRGVTPVLHLTTMLFPTRRYYLHFWGFLCKLSFLGCLPSGQESNA